MKELKDHDESNPIGRVDLLLGKCMEHATNSLDGHLGTVGTWDTLGDAVKFAIDHHVPKTSIEIPPEARILAKLMGWG